MGHQTKAMIDYNIIEVAGLFIGMATISRYILYSIAKTHDGAVKDLRSGLNQKGFKIGKEK